MFSSPTVSLFSERACQLKIKSYCFYQVIISYKNSLYQSINPHHNNFQHGVIVNLNEPYLFSPTNTAYLINLIDAESEYGLLIKKALSKQRYLILPPRNSENAMHLMQKSNQILLCENEMTDAVNDFLYKIPYLENIEPTPLDERILDAINFIDKNLKESIQLSDVADSIYLSTSRVRHLFKEETGVAISQFILWKRIKKVLNVAHKNNVPISVACRMYNFPDQSHFNHMCVKTFGISPLALLSTYQIIQ